MEPIHLVLLLAALTTSTTAVTPAFPVPFTGFTPYAYSNFAAPRTLPFRPLFSYAYQAEAPSAPLFSPAVPATSFSRVIYAEGASKTPQNDMYRGFAYQTRYTNGGRSEVTFVTGPESKKLMEQNLEFFRTILLPPSRAENSSEPGNSQTLPPSVGRTTTDSTNKLPSAPIPNLQQSSVYRFQLFPAHTSPLLGSPFALHSSINSYFQTLGHSPLASQENAKENGGDDNTEAQESMISVLGRVLAPADRENDISQSQARNFSPEESNSIVDVPTSSSAPDTTQASTSESNSPSTEQISTDNSVANSNEISSTQTQETSSTQTSEAVSSEQTSTSTEQTSSSTEQTSTTEQMSSSTEQTSTSTEDVPATTSEASSSSETESETTTSAQASSSEQNETTTSTEASSAETTTQDDTDLAESA